MNPTMLQHWLRYPNEVKQLRCRVSNSKQQQFPVEKGSDAIMRFASYNVRIDHEDDRGGVHDWERRCGKVTSLLTHYGIDLAALQEPNAAQLKQLKAALPEHRFTGFPVGIGADWEEYLVFCYRPQRVSLLQTQVYTLSETPDAPGLGWDAAYPRVCIYGLFKCSSSGKRFHVFNTHFDHKGEKARVESAKLVLDLMAQVPSKDPRILAGDFNCRKQYGGEQVYAELVGKPDVAQDIRDLSLEPHRGPEGTWVGWEYHEDCSRDGTVGDRIDHIFVGGSLGVRRTGVLTATVADGGALMPEYPGVFDGERDYPSDHLPVVADFILD